MFKSVYDYPFTAGIFQSLKPRKDFRFAVNLLILRRLPCFYQQESIRILKIVEIVILDISLFSVGIGPNAQVTDGLVEFFPLAGPAVVGDV